MRGQRCRRWRSRHGVAAAAAAGLLLGACTGDDGTAPTTTAGTPTTTTLAPRVSDGVLRLGILLPRTGAGGSLGAPLFEVVEAAVGEINAAGGVLGGDIELIARDEGPDLAAAGAAAAALVEQDEVDAIVGPASSLVALSVLPSLVDDGVLTCSPMATAASLADLPDDGLFVRTVASDTLQAQAMVRVIEETGVASTVLAYPDDPYGRRFAQALRVALAGRGIEVAGELAYDPADDSFTDEVQGLATADSPIVALVGDVESGSRVLTALLEVPNGPFVVANDPLLRLEVATLGATVRDQLQRLSGVAVDAHHGGDALTSRFGFADPADVPAFAAAAVDCVDLIALAALQADSDDPRAMAAQVTSLSRGGSSCPDFITCRGLIEQQLNIDYDGPTGLTALDVNGDQSASSFIRYGVEDAAIVALDRFTVSSAP